MNRVTHLVETPSVVLTRFDHPAGVSHSDPRQEMADHHGVNFVEAGAFSIVADRMRYRLEPESVFVTTPGLEFSCEHDEDQPSDQCLSISYSEGSVEELRGAGATRTPQPVLPATNRRAYLRRRLASYLDGGDPARVEALAGAIYFALAGDLRESQPFRCERFSWYATRIDRAKDLIASSFAEPLSLTAIAREVGMSTYHFARVFRDLEGEPPHRYLTGVRLREARNRLRDRRQRDRYVFRRGIRLAEPLRHHIPPALRHNPLSLARRSFREGGTALKARNRKPPPRPAFYTDPSPGGGLMARKRVVWGTLCLALVAVVAASALRTGGTVTAAVEPARTDVDPEVLAVREAAWRAWFAGDERALGAMLPPEFIAIGAHGNELNDKATTLESARAFKASGGTLVSLSFPETRAQRYGDTMILYGRYEAVMGKTSGNETMRGRYTEIFVRRDGKWIHPGWHLDAEQ